MTLSIEIEVLRGLDNRLPSLTATRRDLIDLAAYVAGEINRARQSGTLYCELLEAPEQPNPVPDMRPEPPAQYPDAMDSPPEPVESQPQAVPMAPIKGEGTDLQVANQVQTDRDQPSIGVTAAQVSRTESAIRGRLLKPKAAQPKSSAFGRPWTDQDDAILLRQKRAGLTWGAIASELDRTSRSAEQRYLRLKKQGALAEPVPSPSEPAPAPAPSEHPSDQQTTEPTALPAPHSETVQTTPDSARVPNIGDLSKLKVRQRSLVMHLANLSDEFEPIDDLDIIEGLLSGKKPTAIADELSCRPDDVTKRWRAMLTDDVVNRFGTPTIDGQQDVLTAARHLVKCAEARHG